jgi:hypothetical protein
LVVNSPSSHLLSAKWQADNILFINQLKLKYKSKSNAGLLEFNPEIDILIIDRNSVDCQIPEKKGVGLARKIGADIALKLHSLGCIKYPWIFSTDADVTLPDNYFSQVKSIDGKKYSAIVNEFEHLSNTDELRKCQFLYDTKLRYYQAGIEYSGSQYDYIPLGSTLIVNTLSYAQVRGFPQRNAAEDFYILNKLAKVNEVFKSEDCIVEIKARFSDRVPFGTGPALKQILNADEYLYYHPECFILLKQWCEYLKQMWSNNQLNSTKAIPGHLLGIHNYLNFRKVINSVCTQITTEKNWHNFIHQWMDAFKTLKVVHYFDKQYPRLGFQQLLNNESFVKLSNSKLTKHLIKK